MADEKTAQSLLRAMLKEMEKTLAEPKPYVRPPGAKTRVNVEEFNKAQQGENWGSDGGDEDQFIGLRPRPKPRAKRRLR